MGITLHFVFTPPLFANLFVCSACKLLCCAAIICLEWLLWWHFVLELWRLIYVTINNSANQMQFIDISRTNEMFVKHLLPPPLHWTYIVGCTSLYYKQYTWKWNWPFEFKINRIIYWYYPRCINLSSMTCLT